MILRLGGYYEKKSDNSLWILTRVGMRGECVLEGTDRVQAHITDSELRKFYAEYKRG